MDDLPEYRDYVSGRLDRWRRVGYLLCGNWHTADDLVSTVLVKLYRQWRRISTVDDLDAYVRRMMLRAWLDERRRPWRREQSWSQPQHVGDPAAMRGPALDVEVAQRVSILARLAELPPRRRAVLVLRFDFVGAPHSPSPVRRSPAVTPRTPAEGCAAAIARLDRVLIAAVDAQGTALAKNGSDLFVLDPRGAMVGGYGFAGRLGNGDMLFVYVVRADNSLVTPAQYCGGSRPDCLVHTEPDGTTVAQETIKHGLANVRIAKPDGTDIFLTLGYPGELNIEKLTAIGLDPGMTLYP